MSGYSDKEPTFIINSLFNIYQESDPQIPSKNFGTNPQVKILVDALVEVIQKPLHQKIKRQDDEIAKLKVLVAKSNIH